jgi:hypothetical protein
MTKQRGYLFYIPQQQAEPEKQARKKKEQQRK